MITAWLEVSHECQTPGKHTWVFSTYRKLLPWYSPPTGVYFFCAKWAFYFHPPPSTQYPVIVLTSTLLFSSDELLPSPSLAPSHAPHTAPTLGPCLCLGCHFSSQCIRSGKPSSPPPGSTHLRGCIGNVIRAPRPNAIRQKPIGSSQLCGMICTHFGFTRKPTM